MKSIFFPKSHENPLFHFKDVKTGTHKAEGGAGDRAESF
jgi:hypothetical protein